MKRWACVFVPVVVLALVQGQAAYGAFDPLQDPALIGWWKCDEGQGSVVADASAAHHDGTFVDGNPAWVAGALGQAIELVDPTVVEVPPMGLTLTEATMVGWVYPYGPQVRWASIIMHRGPGPAHGFNLAETRQLVYHWNGLAATYNFRGNAYYANDEWTHCALTIQPTKATFYVNGVEAAVNAIAHDPATWDGRVWFGGDRTYTGTRHLKGALDEILFFSRALTAAEIKSLVPPKLKAMKPNPADGAINITMPLLQWTAGETAVFHNVYLGTTPELTEAHLVGKSQLLPMLYYLQGFAPGTTYYWRVDEITAAGVVTTGDVWASPPPQSRPRSRCRRRAPHISRPAWPCRGPRDRAPSRTMSTSAPIAPMSRAARPASSRATRPPRVCNWMDWPAARPITGVWTRWP